MHLSLWILSSRAGGVRPWAGLGGAGNLVRTFNTLHGCDDLREGAGLSFWTPLDQYGVKTIVIFKVSMRRKGMRYNESGK